MKKFIFAAVAAAIVPFAAVAQPAQPEADYQFTVVKENPITPVKNQYRSSTCWCFSTLGFLESETIRIKNIKDTTLYPDFSEMFVVSHSYKDRAVKYVRTDGNINFAAVLIADELAAECDFFSIGTNDLTQYTCALDRQNAKLEPFFNPHHPAVLRAIKMTIDAGHRHGIWVGICGELGADTALTETFLRMGVDELSMNAKSVLPVRIWALPSLALV